MKRLLVILSITFSLEAMEKAGSIPAHYKNIPFAQLVLKIIVSVESSSDIIEVVKAQYNEYKRIEEIIKNINRARGSQVITLKPFEELCTSDLIYIKDWLIANKTQLLADPVEQLTAIIAQYLGRAEQIEQVVEKTEKLLAEKAAKKGGSST